MANVKIGLFGKLDMLKFKNITKVREKHIQASPTTPLPKVLPTNEKAKQHHPEKQEVVIADIRQNGSDAKTIVLKTPDGSRLALFRAGQYVSVLVPIGGTVTTRSYSLCSSPALAKQGEYHITVKRDDAGFVSPYIQDHWQIGQKVTVSGPEGHLYFEPLRDAKKVVALAGGSGSAVGVQICGKRFDDFRLEESAFVRPQLSYGAENRPRPRHGLPEHGFAADPEPGIRYPFRPAADGRLSECGTGAASSSAGR